MKMKSFFFFPLSIIVILTFFVFGCQNNIALDNTDNINPIELRFETKQGKRFMTWDAVNSISFRKYILVESRNEIPNGIIPLESSPHFISFIEIDSMSISTFELIALPISNKSYFKLYVDIGSRFIESQTLEIKNELFSVPGLQTAFYYDGNAHLYGLNAADKKLIYYSLTDLKIEKEYKLSQSISFTSKESVLSINNTKDEILILSDVDIKRIILSTGVLKNRISSPSEGISMMRIGDFLFTTHENVAGTFNIYSITNFSLSLRNTLEVTSKEYFGNLCNYDEENKIFVFFAASNISTYRYNVVDNDLVSVSRIEPKVGQIIDFFNEVIVSKDRKYFIPSTTGFVFDRNFNPVGKITTSNITAASFSLDNKYIYASTSDPKSNSVINKYSFPDMKLLESKTLAMSSIKKLISTPNGLIVVAHDLGASNTNIYDINF